MYRSITIPTGHEVAVKQVLTQIATHAFQLPDGRVVGVSLSEQDLALGCKKAIADAGADEIVMLETEWAYLHNRARDFPMSAADEALSLIWKAVENAARIKEQPFVTRAAQ